MIGVVEREEMGSIGFKDYRDVGDCCVTEGRR